MGAVLPGDLPLVEETQVRLVRKGGGLKRVPRAFAPDVSGGQASHFVVDEREERVERPRISLSPAKKGLRDLRGGRIPLTPHGGFHQGKIIPVRA